jgi:Transposase zinc-ribbon domain
MTAVATAAIYGEETAARAFLEQLRWPEGVICIHCGAFGDAIASVKTPASAPSLQGRARDIAQPAKLALCIWGYPAPLGLRLAAIATLSVSPSASNTGLVG